MNLKLTAIIIKTIGLILLMAYLCYQAGYRDGEQDLLQYLKKN